MSLRKVSDLEGLNIKDHMKDYELSSDAANSLIEISYLSSYGPEDAKNFAYKSMYTRYSQIREDIRESILCSDTPVIFETSVSFTQPVYMLCSLYLSGNFYLNLEHDDDEINIGEKDESRQSHGLGYEMYIRAAQNTLYAAKDDNILCAVGDNVISSIEGRNIINAANGTTIQNIAYFGSNLITFSTGLNLGNNNITADTLVGTALSAKWADLAEYYVADQRYEPGTLVKFGGKNEITEALPGDIVNAVVTSKPGVILNNNHITSEGYMVAIALVGRTPVKVLGPVKKFDNLYLAAPGIAAVYAIASKLQTFNDIVVAKALCDKEQEDFQTSLVECVVQLKM